ncbi:MAG: J domain-containing protein [Acetobacteraceae bacterium]|nr:J domain-containing protein [Acetobacteraceae bacterium]
MPRRGTRSAAYAPQRPLSAEPRGCDSPGCAAAGEFRAPRSRQALDEYLWFCLPHVREYNAAWDFYRGMSAGEIEGHLRQDTAWQRPTWPLGRLGGQSRFDPEALRDPLGALHGTPLHEARRRRQAEAAARAGGLPAVPPPELRAALDVLGLDWPLEQPALRARYKELAKRLHPDANGGDRGAEEQLKDVNRAYSLVRARLGAAAARARAAGAEAAAS